MFALSTKQAGNGPVSRDLAQVAELADASG